jgi:hypothetical protein
MTNGNRVDLWNRRLTAKFNVCYYGCLVRRVERQDACLRFSLAVFSSGTVATFLVKAGPGWMQGMAVVTMLLTLVRTTAIDTGKRLERFGGLYGRWSQLAHRYHDLWVRANQATLPEVVEASIVGEIAQVAEREVDVRTDEKTVPRIRRLLEKCREDILREEGLK